MGKGKLTTSVDVAVSGPVSVIGHWPGLRERLAAASRSRRGPSRELLAECRAWGLTASA